MKAVTSSLILVSGETHNDDRAEGNGRTCCKEKIRRNSSLSMIIKGRNRILNEVWFGKSLL